MRLRAISIAAALAGLAAPVTLAAMFALPELTVISVASALLLILSAAWLRIGVARFANNVELSTSHPAVHVGDTTELFVTVRNDKSAASMPAELRYSRTHNNTTHNNTTHDHGAGNNAAGSSSARLGVGSLDPGGTCGLTIRLDTSRRGIHQIGGWFWYLRDPLRLWRHRDPIPTSAVLKVRPRTHDLGSPPGVGTLVDLQDRSSKAAIRGEPDGDLIGLRPYTPGDDMRLIHWRTSARLNHPHVVQTEPPPTDAVFQLLLDTHLERDHPTDASDTSAVHWTPSSSAAFERSLEATVSIALNLADSGSSLRLLATGGWDSGTLRPDAISTILDWLTSVQPTSADPQPRGPALPRSFSPDVVIGTDWRSIAAAIAHGPGTPTGSHPSGLPPSTPPTRILLCPPVQNGPMQNDPMQNYPSASRDETPDPVVTWRPDEPLAAAWARLLATGHGTGPDARTRVGR